MIIIWKVGGKKDSRGKTVAKVRRLDSATMASDSLFVDMPHCEVEIRVMSSDFGDSIWLPRIFCCMDRISAWH